MMSGPGSEEARGDARSGGVRVSRFSAAGLERMSGI